MQLRFTAQILDTYNGIGIVLANRQDNKESIPYLEKAQAAHKTVMDACASKDNLMQFIEQLDLTELDKVILKDLQS